MGPVHDGTPCDLDALAGVCVEGVCQEDPCQAECDDIDNPCEDFTCDYVAGRCVSLPGGKCDDGNYCTSSVDAGSMRGVTLKYQ